MDLLKEPEALSGLEWRLNVAALLLSGSLLTAQLASAQSTATFLDTVDVNVVNVEVMVTDRDGVPVTGLGRDAFTIREDGVEMEVSNFFAVAGGQVVSAAGSPDDAGALPVPATRRLQLVLLFDDLNIRPENRNRMIEKLRDYLSRRTGAGDLMMLVRTGHGITVEQPFTQDVGLVLAALARIEKRVGRRVTQDAEYRDIMRRINRAKLARPDPLNPLLLESALLEAIALGDEIRLLAEQRRLRVKETVETIGHFTRTLAGLPGRKGVLYVSDGTPMRAAEVLIAAWQGKFEAWLRASNQARAASRMVAIDSLEFDSTYMVRRLVEEATANRVSFYPISNTERSARASVSAELHGDLSEGAGPSTLAAAGLESTNLDASLLRLAEGTGGVAFTRSDKIGELLDRMRQDFSSFYSLGYLRASDEDGDYHRIEVEVGDPSLRVRHLEGFRLRDPFTHLQDLTLSALHHGFEENPLEVALLPGAQTPTRRGRFIVSINVAIPFRKLLLLPEEESHLARVALVVAVRDERGGVSEPQRILVPIRVPNERILETADGHAAYPLRLELKPGAQMVSVGVRDQLARVDSTLTVAIEVGAGAELGRPSDARSARRARRHGDSTLAVAPQ